MVRVDLLAVRPGKQAQWGGVHVSRDDRIDGVRNDLRAQNAALRDELGVRIDKVADELVEVKIAVARMEGPRLEGPRRHLITGR